MSVFEWRDLNHSLEAIASDFGLDGEALKAYAEQDPHKGWPTPPWDGGSIWECDGKVLYALVRLLKPSKVLEFGTFQGCGATHILQALHDNEQGHLISVTLDGEGGHIPMVLRDRWTLFTGIRGEDWLDEFDLDVDFIWEDADHLTGTRAILERAKNHAPWIVSHDIGHVYVEHEMNETWRAVFGEDGKDWQRYGVQPADTGLAIWRR